MIVINIKAAIRKGASFLLGSIFLSILAGIVWGIIAGAISFAAFCVFLSAYLAWRIVKANRWATGTAHLFHIGYSDETAVKLPHGAVLLDNRNSPHNDWREYWPIREFLLSKPLKPQEFYGFFSPRFKEKTDLDYEQVQRFMQKSPMDTDVFLFSHMPDWASFFLNPFEQADFVDPGFFQTFDRFLNYAGYPTDALYKPMTTSNTVFSNFIVARPKFWQRWLEVNEKLFALCEGASNNIELRQDLTAETTYTGAVHRKVFLMERVASLILATEPRWKIAAYNSFELAWSTSPLRNFPTEAVACDALKRAMQGSKINDYREAFEQLRKPALKALTRVG